MKSLKNIFISAILLIQSTIITTNALAETSTGIIVDLTSKYLVAPKATSYQWYYNGLILEGSSDQFYTPKESGLYTVEFTDEYGNTKKENAFIIVDAAATVHKVYLIGDSTVANYTSGYYPQTGWGQVLQSFFNSANVVVDNRAVGGTSSKSFYNKYWSGIKNVLQTGDYVFIQFGINDSNKTDTARYTVPFTTFQQYLTKYVNEARSKGAIPVLVSTLCRNSWNATTPPTVYPAYHDYPVATRQLAQSSLNVPLIDLDKMAVALLESVGPDYSTNYLYMHLAAGEYPNYSSGRSDDVHFQEMGAIEMAKLVAQGVSALSQNTSMSFLAQNLLPTYQVTTSSNNTAGGSITRSTTFPAGLNITVKARPATGHTFAQWYDGNNNAVTTALKFNFTMGTAPKLYKGYFDQVNNVSVTVQENTTGFCSVDGTVDSNNAGFTGTGFANTNNASGAGVNWKVNTGSGSHTISWRYANGGGADRPGKLLINGSTIAASVSFPATANWTTWATASAIVNLTTGDKTIRVESTTASGLANIDQITVSSIVVPKAVSCSTTATRTNVSSNTNDELQSVEVLGESVHIYPNPTHSSFVVKLSGPFRYSIYDQLGKEIESGHGKDEVSVGQALKPSSYILKLNSPSGMHQFQLIKE